ncbi:hypothetical protein ACE0DR_27645 [Azotobacter sp. CWF10]
MNMVFEFLLFVLLVPAVGIYMLISRAKSVIDFFGAWLIPGLLCLYFGVLLSLLDQPDPDLEWVVLVIAGVLFLGTGAVIRLKNTK